MRSVTVRNVRMRFIALCGLGPHSMAEAPKLKFVRYWKMPSSRKEG